MKLVSSIITVALALGATQAQAGQASVSYADLNLTKPADQARLNGRIVFAARQLCDLHAASGSLVPSTESKSCFHDAVANAHVLVADAILHRGRTTTLALRTR